MVAIADGHGHARHFRSADGSALAVVGARAGGIPDGRLAAARRPGRAAALAGRLTQAIVARWRARWRSTSPANPTRRRSNDRLDLAERPSEIRYGSTLLVA